MKYVLTGLLFALAVTATGCGQSQTPPVELTPEQVQAMEQRQKEVQGEEMQREKKQPRTRPVDQVEEEERMRR